MTFVLDCNNILKEKNRILKKIKHIKYNEPVINRKKLCNLTEIKEGTIKILLIVY